PRPNSVGWPTISISTAICSSATTPMSASTSSREPSACPMAPASASPVATAPKASLRPIAAFGHHDKGGVPIGAPPLSSIRSRRPVVLEPLVHQDLVNVLAVDAPFVDPAPFLLEAELPVEVPGPFVMAAQVEGDL